MAGDGRSGWLRILGGGTLGGIAGVAVGLAIGFLDAPVVDPEDPLAQEWYTPFVLFTLLPFLGLLGAAVGAIAGATTAVSGGRAVLGGGAGLLLGLGAGAMVPSGDEPSSRLMFHAIVISMTTIGGLGLATRGASRRAGETGD